MSPRLFLVTVIALLTITVVLLLRPLSLSHQPPTLFGRHHSLSAWLKEEDEQYAVTLQSRQQLIQKFGPTPALINP